ncbi:MAG: right-handed parallel beta-helix repeat-containing protein [Pseudomonadota bacterium]
MTVISTIRRGAQMFALTVLLGMLPLAAASQTIRYADPTTVEKVLGQASAGDTVLLTAGSYGHVVLRDVAGRSGAPLTLRSEDPKALATLHRLTIQNAAHVHLQDLRLQHLSTAESLPLARPFRVETSQAVTLRGLEVVGTLRDDEDGPKLPTGIGIAATDIVGFRLEESTFRHLARGLTISRSEDVLISENRFVELRGMGIRFAQISGLTIAGNIMRDFILPSDLNELGLMIAGSTRNTTAPSRDIVIENNLLTSGNGRWTQSIHLRNEEIDENRAGPDLFYQDVTLRNNVIINAHINGIVVGPARGLTIERNTVVRNAASAEGQRDRGWHTPRVLVAEIARDVLILGNVAHPLPPVEWQTDWIVAGNVIVQDEFPTEPNHYDAVFYGVTPTRPAKLTDFAPRPGGALAGRDVGAPQLAGLQPETTAAPRREAASLLEVMRYDPNLGGVVAFAGAGARDKVETVLGRAIEIGRGHAPVVLSAELTAGFFDAAEFDLSLGIRPALGHASKGEVLRIHQNLIVNITDRGVVEADFYAADAAPVRLRTQATRIYAQENLNLRLTYKADTGVLSAYADGALIGQAQSNGRTKSRQSWGLSFGNPFGSRKSFDGTIEAFSLSIRQPLLEGVRADLKP